MTVIVTDVGFCSDHNMLDFVGIGELSNTTTTGLAVHLTADADPEFLRPYLGRIGLIRIDFPSFSDGRGFSIARNIRLMNYHGRLRAKGHVIADQYAMARRCGFDEIEIELAMAARQPEEQWIARSDWRQNDYQMKLRAENLVTQTQPAIQGAN